MATIYICDICKRQTKRMVAKLHYLPYYDENGSKTKYPAHSDYTHSAQVGECCSERILELFNWRKRLPRQEYLAKKRLGAHS